MRITGILAAVLLPLALAGQPDTLVLLPAAEVRAFAWRAGVETDTALAQESADRHLGEVLAQAGPAFVRQYGPGGIATVSLRGGSAAQTALLWNGLPLNSPMIGLADFSQATLFFVDGVGLAPGAHSPSWGSGAVGGVVKLDNRPTSNRISLSAGSFGQWQGSAKYALPLREKHRIGIRLLAEQSDFDYPYRAPDGQVRRQEHARVRVGGAMVEQYWQLKPGHQLQAWTWVQGANRRIPPQATQLSSQAMQDDGFIRQALAYQGQWGRWSVQARGGWFAELFAYRDSVADLNTQSQARTLLGEVLTERRIRNWVISAGAFGQQARAQSNQYVGTATQGLVSLFGALKWYPTPRWSVLAQWRTGPLSPALELRWQGSGQHGFLLRGARSFRLPAFDDLYWSPGGNPDLLPEKGWSIEAGWRWKEIGVQVYSRWVDDWIQWLPQGALWAPRNVLQVWSRGIEGEWGHSWQPGRWTLRAEGRLWHSLSTNQKSRLPNDASVGQQLLYMPRWQGFFSLEASRGAWRAVWTHHYTGPVNVLADGSQQLPGYYLSHLRVAWERGALALASRVDNIWNASYQVVANRPMPGRGVFLSVFINLK